MNAPMQEIPTRILEKPEKVVLEGRLMLLLKTDAGKMTVPQAAELVGMDKVKLGFDICKKGWNINGIFDKNRKREKKTINKSGKEKAENRTAGKWNERLANIPPPTRILEPPVKTLVSGKVTIFLRIDQGWLSLRECAALCDFPYSTKLSDRLRRSKNAWKRKDIFSVRQERESLINKAMTAGSDDEKAASLEWLKLSGRDRFKNLAKLKIGTWEAAQCERQNIQEYIAAL